MTQNQIPTFFSTVCGNNSIAFVLVYVCACGPVVWVRWWWGFAGAFSFFGVGGWGWEKDQQYWFCQTFYTYLLLVIVLLVIYFVLQHQLCFRADVMLPTGSFSCRQYTEFASVFSITFLFASAGLASSKKGVAKICKKKCCFWVWVGWYFYQLALISAS